MTKRFWAVGAVLAIVVVNTGCVTCCHKSYAQALANGAECELPPDCRGRVYVFLLHGITPTTECGLSKLREKLAVRGFAKVGEGELASGFCIASEIKTIHKCEPEAKFVLVGYDLGAAAAVCLSRELAVKGIPVASVVLLDPMGPLPTDRCEIPTLLITSGTTTTRALHTLHVAVPDAKHHTLPAHPVTVESITSLLMEIAASEIEPLIDPVPAWSYKHAPEMRPFVPPTGTEWDFLAEQGPPLPIGTRAISQPVPMQQPVTSAQAVTVPRMPR
jgi:hypothetical protein